MRIRKQTARKGRGELKNRKQTARKRLEPIISPPRQPNKNPDKILQKSRWKWIPHPLGIIILIVRGIERCQRTYTLSTLTGGHKEYYTPEYLRNRKQTARKGLKILRNKKQTRSKETLPLSAGGGLYRAKRSDLKD